MKINLFVLALALGATAAQANKQLTQAQKADPVVTSFAGRPILNFKHQCWTDMRHPGAFDACIEAPKPVAVKPAPAPVQETAPQIVAVPEVKAHFAYNKASLRKADVVQIKKVANTYATIVGKQPNTTIKVSGYADPTGNAAHNLKLSRDRAFATRQVLVKAGVPAKAIQTEGLGAQDASGECTKAGSKKAKIDCLQVDRRAEITVQAR